MKRIALEETTSTNAYAKTLPEDGNHELTLVTTEFQTAGRGAGTNTWESERGKNLLFSLVVYPQRLQANQMFALSEVTALAIRDALVAQCSMFNVQCSIKWPNDVYYNDKKIVGMLIENDLRGKWVRRSIIGVGVDVNQTRFLGDAPNPVSLAQILGKEVDRDQVLESILHQFNYYYGMMEREQFAELHNRYMQYLYRKNGMHSYADTTGTFQARIIDVEPTGHLVLECQNGEQRRYDFKEVKFI
ncbi:MAG: biotin--[acetyl-CoA-carboxylase] ligase [Bacteroidaceae bacterium]|nr:biotin--[acetyl-CoA-carboxylase] ligase [Bacteroidaceae bacterium]MBO4841212.1 biotin--[acetyl-CoA-carboxylase] ligase [Bacteroidaceae bacterium]